MSDEIETLRISNQDVTFDEIARLTKKHERILTGKQRERIKWFLLHRNYHMVAQRLDIGSSIEAGSLAVRNSIAYAYRKMQREESAIRGKKQRNPVVGADFRQTGLWVPARREGFGVLFELHGVSPIRGVIERVDRQRDHRYPDKDVSRTFAYRCALNVKPANDSRIFIHVHGAWHDQPLDAVNEGDELVDVLKKMLDTHQRNMKAIFNRSLAKG